MLTDITEELWTGRGAEVQAGENISKMLSLSTTNDRNFQDMFLQKLYDEGMLEYNEDNLQITGANMHSLRRNGRTGYHELEIEFSAMHSQLPGQPINSRIGVEFNPLDREQGRYRLRMFPKVITDSGKTMPVVLEKNSDLPQSFTQVMSLGYWLLQQNNYVRE